MFKNKTKFLLSFLLLVAFFAIGGLAFAQTDFGLGAGDALNLGNADPRTLIVRIIQIVLGFLGVLAVGFIVYGGFVWMTSNGDESRVERAKKIIVSAVIGLVIILSSFAIATYVISRLSNATGSPGSGSGNNGGGGGSILPGGGGFGSSCDSNTLTQTCEADDGLCADGFYCGGNDCTCIPLAGIGDSCDNESDLDGCQANGLTCAPGLYCDTDSCTCQTGDGEGQSCDADEENSDCQAGENICSRGLACDSFGANPTCTCIRYPVIESISPAGGFCTDNINKFCTNDSDCSDSICDLTTPNGAAGNVVVIDGYNFGTTTGEVFFWDGSDFGVEASLPNNPLCDENWQDDRVVIVVPAGAKSGPIRVVTADSKNEDSNNEVGVVLPDFIVNSINRPGICKIDPISGSLSDEINYYGVNLNNSTAEFGKLSSSISGRNSSFGSVNGSSLVPNIRNGNTTTFVLSSFGIPSNYLKFSKFGEENKDPEIISFSPNSGASGQYITIYGSSFGSSRGDSAVYFGSAQSGREADYSFPKICADSLWSDKEILVKVPDGISNGNYTLTLEIDGRVVDISKLSPNFFRVDSELSLTPSLCKIEPKVAQIKGEINLWGEYFAAFDNSLSKVRFYNSQDTFGLGRISLWEEEGSGSNRAYHVKAVVPDGAITGPVSIIKNQPEEAGNGINLEIGSCLDAINPNTACGNLVCCPKETYASGRCVDSVDDCSVDIPSSVFEWDFSTKFDLGGDDIISQSCADRSRVLSSCPSGACFNSPGDCSANGEECECCCRKDNGNNDCCAGLTCAGTCGSDRDSDTNTYGACSGCRIEVNGVVDQQASDNACNCEEGSSYAKYCDVDADINNDGVPEGTCGDCASLNPESCTQHSNTCCVNGADGNNCIGRQFARGDGNLFDLVSQNGLAYCGYYTCDIDGGCSNGNPTAFPGEVKKFKTDTDCQLNCGGSINPGLSCEREQVDSCDNSICSNPFSCHSGFEGGCGYCCCDPSNDQCSILNSDLKCQPNVSPCGGDDRGLCCGCSDNTQCVSSGNEPIGIGCGIDSCCRARPSVIDQFPADGSVNTCTNAAIYADFNQIMQPSSFKGNAIVAGEYSGDCPKNSVLISFDNNVKTKKVASLFDGVKEFFQQIFGHSVNASSGPNQNMNYCAISGSIDSEQIGENSTRLIFRPTGLLDVGVKYFVIIKGDDALDNSKGVKSSVGIGMYANNSPVDNTSSFGNISFTRLSNGETYAPAYIWSFTTRNTGNNGLCDISKVEIKPSSYLFNVADNDLNEDDVDSDSDSFDKTKDSDKVFVANAYSSDNQKLYPVSGYSWQWNWSSSNISIAEVVTSGPFGENADSQLVRARNNILDGRTEISAEINIIDDTASDVGDELIAVSEVYVFICENPWPAVKSNFTWQPWRDSNSNCLSDTGNCYNTGQEIYYCRDNDKENPLPAISSGTTRGSGEDILKESYFFDQN